ncbi:membrane protein [Limosilactobacillus panis]|jgi:hypothetical protein|uniref:DUF308 domain-containing protein n=1 Tax=Limosilactobacillus panis DSM 6035 TaxID=1423782 RepID=A0A0R1X4J5_9LACO|nr:membrane protein [Limosilactobacillus panis]KRM25112.1 hypothetical protein FD32_GL001009 [Limosilactobacillus panis DSM 6035]QZN93765.1 DUF308 domain-containing protein [Limosilactobacillus panis]
MIFLVIFGGLMLILGGFYLANSWQRYREWKSGTVIVVLSLIAVIFGTINLPVFKGHQQVSNQSSSSSQQVSQSSFSNGFSTINGGQQGSPNHQMAVLRQLQKGYSKLGTVSFNKENNTYTIKPTADNTVQAVKAIVSDPSQASQMGWSNLTNSIKKNSSQVSTALNGDYTIRIVNPDNTDQAVYSAKNGKTTYNIADN